MAINIASFSHLLKRVDFDAIVDHLALMHIIKSKMEPATTRIKRLLELMSSYSFNLYYMKGKDMILSDFLSQQKNDDSSSNKIIPISFDMYQVLEDNFYLENFCTDKYLIQTQSQAKSSGIKLPEVHGLRKKLDPNLRPEKQHTLPKQGSLKRLCIGQGRARSKRKRPDLINQAINQSSKLSQEIPGRTKIETRKTNHVHTTDPAHSISNADDMTVSNDPLIPDAPFHPGPILRPPIKQNMTHDQSLQNVQNINSNINFDFEENSPFQEGFISKTFQRPDKSFFQEPKELEDLINKGNFVHKYLSKQMDIDKILKIIQRKVLKGTHLPIKIKEIQAGYLCSPYFKDLYLYLLQNKLPSSKPAIRKIETLAERYVILDSLFFRISSENETTAIAVPETCVDKIITLYHKSLFAGHQGVIKTYLTISYKILHP